MNNKDFLAYLSKNSKAISNRLNRMLLEVAEEHCMFCDAVFYGYPDDRGRDFCPHCGTYQLLCNLCTIQPCCNLCPYVEATNEQL